MMLPSLAAGSCGLACCFAMYKDRVKNVIVLDRAPKGQEGPWITYFAYVDAALAQTCDGA